MDISVNIQDQSDIMAPETPVKQRYLGRRGMIFFIAMMNMFVPLSTDMYLPALPSMTEYFSTTTALVNFTLVGFFFMYALGILLFGPLSDKYGRKPVLLASLIIYALASVGCALAMNIYFLIVMRMVESVGAGGVVAVSIALVKDCFIGKARDKILAVAQTLSTLAPMLAPLIGAQLLRIWSWRSSFWVLMAISAICVLLALLMVEPLPKNRRFLGALPRAMVRPFIVGKNISFLLFLISLAMLNAPFMSYISSSSYIYVDYFSLSEQAYSLYFAINAAVSMLGPVIYIVICERIRPQSFSYIILGLCCVAGLCVLLLGGLHPVAFLLSFMPFAVLTGVLRPFAFAVLLNQQKEDTGSASSLINFVNTLWGSIGMLLVSLPWVNYVFGLGTIMIVFSLSSMVIFFILMRSRLPLIGVK